MSNYLSRQREREEKIANAAFDTAYQLALEEATIALRMPEYMGKDTFGPERLQRFFDAVKHVDHLVAPALGGGVEADVAQRDLDAALHEVYGDNMLPFAERYPMVKQHSYKKSRKEWR